MFTNKTKKLTTHLFFAFAILLAFFTSCKDDNLYDPSYVEQIKSQLFDFDMTQDVMLNIDYKMPGSSAMVEIYDEYPYTDDNLLKEGIEPVFSFTLKDGCYTGNLNLPSYLTNVYLCTGGMGIPTLVKASISNGMLTYNNDDSSTAKSSRANYSKEPSNNPTYTTTSPVYKVEEENNLYTLFKDWNNYGKPWDKNYIINIKDTEGYEKEVFNKMIARLQGSIWQGYGSKQNMKKAKKDNSSRATTDESKTNISIVESTYINDKGQTVTINSAKLTLTFLDEYDQTSMNVFGYYYYPTGTVPTTENIKKFIIFPNVTAPNYSNSRKYVETYKKNSPLRTGDRVVLKFMKEDGTLTDRFPAGYTIGWFIYYNGFDGCNTDISVKRENDSDEREGKESLTTKKMNLHATNNNKNKKETVLYYSNPSLNPKKEARCMTITDTETGITSVSFEDSDDNTFDDIIFYVESDAYGTLHNNSGETTGDIPDHTNSYSGTYAFEDIWSSGGDYDMNDVVIEYNRTATITCHNELRRMSETYKVVHNGATYEDGFGITLPYSTDIIESIKVNGQEITATQGTVQSYKGNSPRWEASASENITLILFDDIKSLGNLSSSTTATFKVDINFKVIGTKEDSIITTISGYNKGFYIDENENTIEYETPIYTTSTISRNQYPSTDLTSRVKYNPFIIVYSITNGDKRCEVHLPKQNVTNLGNSSAGEEWNLWFVGRLNGEGERQFPFAIDIPVSCNPNDSKYYKVATESIKITTAYPLFGGWTDSQGSTGTDWYLYPGPETQDAQAYKK